ncbi:hypothetical protein [Actinoplanes utahensis]|uniref:Uncharacterized protein n=1 Tax=Actinoplanes utahensis TaxID=1869 RepID=A0A0A6UFX6_ACTUT|nr:hypothetical protein [Actinoplanes utahensis]KHD74331.1 hypothetical protein MB27_29520 [Actinoplanes utahensis]GIF28272.1 hypothetical protein Aut01nite_12580 [Actinoplanes utahensis]
MNDIDLLNEHGPDASPLSEEAWRSARTKLASEISPPARSRRWGLMPRIAVIGLAGVAAVAATVAVLPEKHPDRERPPTVTAQGTKGSPGPIRLVAATAPQYPFSLPGFDEVSYTADPGGPVMGIFGPSLGENGPNNTVVLVPLPEKPSGSSRGEREIDVDGRPGKIESFRDGQTGEIAAVQLNWERKPGQWVTIVGNGTRATEDEVLRLARSVVDEPRRLNFKVTLGLAPDGWVLGGFKGDDKAVSIISYQDPGTDRELHVVWYGTPPEDAGWEGLEAESRVTVNKRPAKLIRTTQNWIVVGSLPDGASYQLMAPRDFTTKQVVDLAGSIRIH